MQYYQKPPGCSAGSDQVDAMEEGVNTHIEQMFEQVAKRNVLDFGVGRTTTKLSTNDTRLDAKRRECDAQAMFHAGRALELALQVVYARGADRIIGREYPGVSQEELKKDREGGHGLRRLYQQIIDDLDERVMESAFEDVFQTALHKEIIDVYLDDKLVTSFFQAKDVPFSEKRINSMTSGVEYTLDHSSPKDMIFPRDTGPSDFSKMPYKTFEQFLDKADASYYESDILDKRGNTILRNMRWSHYSARDHEYARPYVVVGVEFFARLVKGIITLSNQPWIWDKEFAERFFERHQNFAIDKLKVLAKQNLEGEVEFPDPIPVKHLLDSYMSFSENSRIHSAEVEKTDYSIHHTKLRYVSKESKESS